MSTWKLAAVVALAGCTSEYAVHGVLVAGPGAEAIDLTPPLPPSDEPPMDWGASEVTLHEYCPPVPGRWDVVVEWNRFAFGGGNFSLPVVGHLDDDNGDGSIGGPGDLPEVVFGAPQDGTGHFGVWRSDGTPKTWLGDQFHNQGSNAAIADVNADGVPELVIVAGDFMASRLEALTPDGTVLWRTEDFFLGRESPNGDRWTYTSACQPVVTDLEGDGHPEVVCDNHVFDGETGANRSARPFDTSNYWISNAVADLDHDGLAEVLTGNKVLRADGSLRFQGPAATLGGWDSYPAAVDLDGDQDLELLFASSGRLHASDTDGTPLWNRQVTVAQNGASTPCVADFDGDGAMEIVGAFSDTLVMLERDGRVVWQRAIQDVSSAASCSAFDFDGDGAAEVAYADEVSFGLYDGGTGEVLFRDERFVSGTLTEFPVIVDLDGDDSVEILVGRSYDGMSGVVVYGQCASAWQDAGSAWPQADYRLTNQAPDGFVDGTAPLWPGVHSRPAGQ